MQGRCQNQFSHFKTITVLAQYRWFPEQQTVHYQYILLVGLAVSALQSLPFNQRFLRVAGRAPRLARAVSAGEGYSQGLLRVATYNLAPTR